MKTSRYQKEILSTKFGKLTPIKCVGQAEKSKRTLWLCRCDCGEEKIFRSDCLRQGSSKSCGCSRKGPRSENKNWRGFGGLSKTKWTATKLGAIKRNLCFDISIEFCWNLLVSQNFKCAVSGLEISLSEEKNNNFSIASLDRKDSSKGYTEDNVWWVHRDINIMKWNFELDHFLKMCEIITNFKQNNFQKG